MWRLRDEPHTPPVPFTPDDEHVMEIVIKGFEYNRGLHERNRAERAEAAAEALWLRERERDELLEAGAPISQRWG